MIRDLEAALAEAGRDLGELAGRYRDLQIGVGTCLSTVERVKRPASRHVPGNAATGQAVGHGAWMPAVPGVEVGDHPPMVSPLSGTSRALYRASGGDRVEEVGQEGVEALVGVGWEVFGDFGVAGVEEFAEQGA